MKKTLLAALALISACCLKADEMQTPELALVYPISQAAGKINVDGDLNDAGWKNAVKVSSFTDSGSPNLAIQQTVMSLAYDSEKLYLGIQCFESSMKTLKTPSTGLDAPFWNDDSIEFFLDLDHTHQSHYQFAVTANEAKFDSKEGDALWTKVWDAKTQKYADKWTVEIAIPLEIFDRPGPKTGDFWGFNLCRERQAGGKHELFNWADVQRVFNRTNLFGHLLFMPANWENNQEAIAKAKQGAGRTETQLQLQDGYWSFTPDRQQPRKLSYTEACRERFAVLPPKTVELINIFKENPNLSLKKEFDKIIAEFYAWKQKAQASNNLTSIDYAQANVFFTSFMASNNSFYWKVKLDQLNSSF